VSFENRMLVSLQWLWRYVSAQNGARLITNPSFGPDMKDSGERPTR
jgi:hypothetical protein